MNKLLLIFTILALLILAPSGALAQAGPDPVIYYVSAKAGPNQGWENSATKGAAITIWGKNLGTSRGSSTVTVAGVTLNQDSDYAEWGATTNPTTAKGFQRITFWLNSNMPNGNTAGIYVTVGGVQSNTLPFKIDNTASGRIRFIDQANGNDAWDGQYADHTLGGNHGPWAIPFTNVARDGYLPGAFIYMRAATYTSIMIYGCHAPWGGCVGACEGSSSGCYCYETPYGGTDDLRMTLTSYPGELAHLFNVRLGFDSDYWTVANLKWDGDLTHQNDGQGNVYVALQMGHEDNCVNCPYRNVGLQVIGNEFTGNLHCALHTFSDNCNVLGNYFSTYPTLAGMGIDQSDPMYISSGIGMLIQNNEIHGGSNWAMQLFDENRCGSSGNEIPGSRGFSNVTIDSNLLDMDRSAVTPYQKAGALVLGIYSPTGFMNNVMVKNNVMTNTDGLISQAGIKLDLESGATGSGIYIYSNTVDMGNSSGKSFIYGAYATATYSNLETKNNILTNIDGGHTYSQGMFTGMLWDYNFMSKALSQGYAGSATDGGHNLVGNPLYVAPASRDYHLQSSSPAKDAGQSLAIVTRDYDGISRPQGSAYDIGAYEYLSGSSYDTQPPAIQITSPTSNPTYSTASSPFSISGTASDNTSVSQVTWVNNRGGSGTATGTTSWSVSGIALQSGDNAITVTARDPSGNTGADTLTVTYTAPDTTPPVRSGGSPSGTLSAGTTSTTISLTTDEPATCRYSTTSGVAYSSMANSFSGAGSTSHSSVISGLQNGTSYSYYVRCQDTAGNPNTNDFTISFSVAVPGACIHEADSNPCNGCVEMGELNAYISRWQVSNLDVTLRKLMEAIGFWKSGTGCTVPACPEGQITSSCTCGGTVYSSGYCCSGAWQSSSCGVTPNCPTGQITSSCICEGATRTSGYCCTNDYETLGACCPNGPVTSRCYCENWMVSSDYCCNNFWSSGACS